MMSTIFPSTNIEVQKRRQMSEGGEIMKKKKKCKTQLKNKNTKEKKASRITAETHQW